MGSSKYCLDIDGEIKGAKAAGDHGHIAAMESFIYRGPEYSMNNLEEEIEKQNKGK